MASLPRIMVVDHKGDVGRVVRAALDLLNQPAIVVDVPSSREALLELQSISFGVLVTAYNLPGMNGLELVKRASVDVDGIRCIVLADPGDPLSEDDGPGVVLVRPMAASRFVKTLQRALGMEVEEESAAAGEGAALPPVGVVPEVDLEELSDLLNNALISVGAMAAILMDRTGKILLEHGAVGYLDREKLSETFAAPFTALAYVAGIVGGRQPSALYLWDGKDFDIYALSAGLHHFVCLVFESTGGKQAALGPVTRWGRRAVDDMVELIGPAAFEIAQPVEAPQPKPAPARPIAAPARPAAATPSLARVEPASPPASAARPPAPTVEVDDAVLKAALSKIDDIDPDAFWESVGGNEGAMTPPATGDDEDGLSFDEALQLGLLPPDLGND
ncbi:MAG: hypothetical protein JXB47_15720 [Anaerolineae bacterium]|nr:hypothetical protein [Anaerolineae bacterium]